MAQNILEKIRLSMSDDSDLVVVTAVQGDNLSSVLPIELYNDQDLVELTGYTVYFNAIKYDGSSVCYQGGQADRLEVQDDTIYLTLTDVLLAVKGTCKCEISLVKGHEVWSTYQFNIYVYASPSAIQNYNQSDLATIKQVLVDVDRAEIAAEKAEAAVIKTEEFANKAEAEANRAKSEADNANASAVDAANSANEARESLDEVRNEVIKAQAEVVKASNEANRSKIEADRSSSEADRATSEANKSSSFADNSEASAIRSESAASSSEEHANNASEYATNAETWSKYAKSYANGETGIREDENTDNAKYYSLEAKKWRDEAEAIVGIDVATYTKAGLVRPNEESFTLEADGLVTVRSMTDATISSIINTIFK